jgi:hypothetical protein
MDVSKIRTSYYESVNLPLRLCYEISLAFPPARGYISGTMKLLLQAVLVPFLLAGCAPSFEGIRMRAESPGIDEAFRKMGAAVEMDGYKRLAVDPAARALRTEWRLLREEETDPRHPAGSAAGTEARITVKLASRGKLYDVFLGLYIRKRGDGDSDGVPAPADHPLTGKWRKVLGTLLDREGRDED